MKRFILIAVSCTVCGIGALCFLAWPYIVHSIISSGEGDTLPRAAVVFEDVRVSVDVADTVESRKRGLGGRTSLPRGTGMLFLFDTSDTYGMWMKDMHFPIDIIWLDASLRVVDLHEQADPASYPTVFKPMTDARYVLEVPSGFVREHQVTAGMQALLERH